MPTRQQTFQAVLQTIRDVTQEGSGSARTVSPGRFSGSMYESLNPEEKSRRGLVAARIEPSFSNISINPASPPRKGNVALYDVQIEVRVIRHLNAEHKLDDSARDEAQSYVASDAAVLSEALTYSSNLISSSAGVATGLVGKNLAYQQSAIGTLELGSDGPGLVETVHTFTGIVQASV